MVSLDATEQGRIIYRGMAGINFNKDFKSFNRNASELFSGGKIILNFISNYLLLVCIV